jgi:cytochrome P450
MNRDSIGFLTRCARQYGDLVRLRFGPLPAYLVTGPALIEQVLVSRQRDYIRPRILRNARITFGNSMFVSSGGPWRRQRRLAQPAFHHRRIAGYGDEIVHLTERMLNRWSDGARRDVNEEMSRLTLAIVARCLFDVDVEDEGAEVAASLHTVQHAFMTRVSSPIPLRDDLPTPNNIRNALAVRRLHALVDRFAERARRGEDRTSLVAMLVEAYEGQGDARRQLRDEAQAFLLAGHETSALALTWTFLLLSEHPDVERRLVGELDERLGGRAPTAGDIADLPFTRAVVKEALRLYPPAHAFAREAQVDTELGGQPIRAGSTVLLSVWAVHRDPRWYPEAERFDPSRWEDDLEKRLPRFAYFPFGGGPHLCIGAGFAQLETTLVLATVAQRFRLTLRPGHPVEPEPLITLRPRYGAPMELATR